MSGAELYRAMVEYVEARGWKREEAVSGWFLHDERGPFEGTLGQVVEEELRADGIDTRYPPQWSPASGPVSERRDDG